MTGPEESGEQGAARESVRDMGQPWVRLAPDYEISGRRFDRILFLQTFGYASDPVRTVKEAKSMLTDEGFILLTRTQPIRYALERAERNGTSLGDEYFSGSTFSYRSGWNDHITLTKRAYKMSDLLNVFSAAGLWIEAAVEPRLSEEAGRRYPHKLAWMNKYLGILIFKLRPLAIPPANA